MDTTQMNNSFTNINKLGFQDIWSGAAYNTQRDSLNDLMTKLNKSIEDVNTFDKALAKKEIYIDICETISSYYTKISQCDPDTEDGASAISYYYGQISLLEAQRKTLREEIIAILSKFEGVQIELSGPVEYNVPEVTNPEIPEEPDLLPNYDPTAVTNPDYNGLLLTPSQGRNDYGPQGCETWYDLDMNNVINRMDTQYGIPIEAWVDPNTGVKMCRRVGEETAYVMVAADTESVWWSGENINPGCTYHMGDVVQTSWGPGMVVDYCELAVNKRKAGQENHFDIATAWGTSSYREAGQSYAEEANANRSNEDDED